MAKPHVCPVCNGKGIVPAGFYLSMGPGFTSAGTANEPCRSCSGTGLVWEIELNPPCPELKPFIYAGGRCPCLQPNEAAATLSTVEYVGNNAYRIVRCMKCNAVLQQEPAYGVVMCNPDGTLKS